MKLINVAGDPKPTGDVGLNKTWYDKSLFSQPTGTTKAGFGNSGRNRFRRPAIWNMNVGIFKTFEALRFRPELRIDVANIFDHVNWGAPILNFTANTFMQFTPSSAIDATARAGFASGSE